jgi:peptidoglycan/xylan/chitin deacetylase (PgdA/CDA1 family)
MKVLINDRFFPEKKYALDVLLNDFLKLNAFFVKSNDIEGAVIQLSSKRKVHIEDHFFSQIQGETYLDVFNIPDDIKSTNITYFDGLPLLSLFGPADITISQNEIVIRADIVAATFFMLSRWEETVIKERDINGRFPAKESLSVKHGFHDRPIVNEYVEVLWKTLSTLDQSLIRMQRSFNFLLTHDVDLPRMWWNPKDFIKSIGGALVKRKSVKDAFRLTRQYITQKDPFNVFDYMMSLSEKFDFTSYFFFMSGGTSPKDNYYKIKHPVIRDLIREIKERGHEIGFHPSFNAYNDIEQFTKERELLEDIAGVPIKSGRHHFLRFENPTTWQIWEDNGMHWDSTMCYHDKEGFRCGVCYPFPVFNILTRKKLSLKERPLTVMEGSFITYQKDVVPDEMLKRIKKLIDTTRRYNGEFVFLWHNSAFVNTEYRRVYEEILTYTAKKYS